jgi:hypothetical protein
MAASKSSLRGARGARSTSRSTRLLTSSSGGAWKGHGRTAISGRPLRRDLIYFLAKLPLVHLRVCPCHWQQSFAKYQTHCNSVTAKGNIHLDIGRTVLLPGARRIGLGRATPKALGVVVAWPAREAHAGRGQRHVERRTGDCAASPAAQSRVWWSLPSSTYYAAQLPSQGQLKQTCQNERGRSDPNIPAKIARRDRWVRDAVLTFETVPPRRPRPHGASNLGPAFR